MKVQDCLIRGVLRPLSAITGKLSERTQNALFVTGCLLMFLWSFLIDGLVITDLSYFYTFLFGCLTMGLMILAVLRKDIQPIHFSPVLLTVWLSFGVLVAISALRFNTDWLSDAIVYLIACPIAFIVWGNIDQKRFLSLLSKSCIFSFLVFIAVSMLLFPINYVQYSGFMGNTNGAANYLSIVFACLICESYRPQMQRKKRIFVIVLLGICTALLYYTGSRTGQLSAIAAFVVVSCLYLIQNRHQLKRLLFRRLLPVILSVMFFLPATLGIFSLGYRTGNTVLNAVQHLVSLVSSEHPGTDAMDDWDDADDNKTSFSDFWGINQQRNDATDKTLDQFSSGRISIWKAYWKHVKLFGSGTEEKFWIAERQCYYTTAHMTHLTYAFRHGLVAAVLFFCFNILAGLKALRFAWKHTDENYALLPIAITMIFGVTSVLASVETPFRYMIIMYYFFVQTPLMKKSCEKREN